MDTFTLTDVRRLTFSGPPPVVSLFMPTHRVGEQMQQDPIRLKNLLTRAESLLEEHGVRPVEARELLEPATDLQADAGFWKDQADGLAMYVFGDGTLRYLQVPMPLEAAVCVGRTPCVRPLLAAVSSQRAYYVVAVSLNQARLFRGSREGLSELPRAPLPEGMSDALHYDEPQGMLGAHTGQTALRGKESAVFHGQGGAVDARKDDILAYFRLIDRALRKVLHNEHAPLIFAGVDSLLPLYRRANTYPHLLDAGIAGNPDRATPADLRAAAETLLAASSDGERKRDAETIAAKSATAWTSTRLEEIVTAAYQGRVAALFVRPEAHRWGRYVVDRGRVESHADRQPGDDDLFEVAAQAALASGARVYVAQPDELVGIAEVAALYRYSLTD
ncbi:MAG: hypothetical protein K1X74_05170 [Pirellulales bacterium]|nr:hypothetical protein [Pirellulales bacterium]